MLAGNLRGTGQLTVKAYLDEFAVSFLLGIWNVRCDRGELLEDSIEEHYTVSKRFRLYR